MEMYTLILLVVSVIMGMFILYFVIKTAVVNGIKESGILERRENSLTEHIPAYYTPNSAQSFLKSRYERGELSFDEYIQEWNKLKD